MLEIKNLHLEVENKEILKGVSLNIEKNEIVAVMGPNGSGKTSLSYAIMGHPNYKITKGEILFNGKKINELDPSERAKLGIFLSFQYPVEISGVTVSNFLRAALKNAKNKIYSLIEYKKLLIKHMNLLNIDSSFKDRYLNEGFSGGEKKRFETLQMSILEPKLAVIDEVDSGLDIDSLNIVADNIKKIQKKNKMGILIITHYDRILEYIKPDKVLIFDKGKIIKIGDKKLVKEIESKGYKDL